MLFLCYIILISHINREGERERKIDGVRERKREGERYEREREVKGIEGERGERERHRERELKGEDRKKRRFLLQFLVKSPEWRNKA